MSRQILAITTCRVSTPEQEENHSLDRQAEAVKKAASELGALIPEDGQWSGSVSSKSGTNTGRKDLKQMLEYCKQHPDVKYLIVHEVDRFMRSVDELFYFEVKFREEVKVKIIYASQPELNTDDHNSKLLKALEAFKGEGSNVERIRKSIDGAKSAAQNGRYTFAPKPGYVKGRIPGIQELHPVLGPILRDALLSIVNYRKTPTQALKDLNSSEFTKLHSPYRMDKFRLIATDPFNAGIIVVNKQVKIYNENGLHEPLITIRQYKKLVEIMSSKAKCQTGPRKNGNPKYPVSNLITCGICKGLRNDKLVGLDLTNGKSRRVYEKYRCRSCKRYIDRQELHDEVLRAFSTQSIPDENRNILLKSLLKVWQQEEDERLREISRLHKVIEATRQTIRQRLEPSQTPVIPL